MQEEQRVQPDTTGHDGLLDRVELVETQPLANRAAGFEQLHDELLAELQRSDSAAAQQISQQHHRDAR